MQILQAVAWTVVNSVFEQSWFFKGVVNLQCNPMRKEGRENCYFQLHTDELIASHLRFDSPSPLFLLNRKTAWLTWCLKKKKDTLVCQRIMKTLLKISCGGRREGFCLAKWV